MPVVTFDPAAFREAFPEFADATKYPNAMLQLRFDAATLYFNNTELACGITEAQWTSVLYLMTAHLLYLRGLVSSGASGGTSAPGIVSSGSVGDVSVTRAVPPFSDGWDYWMNLSPYGQELLALLSLLGGTGEYVGSLPEGAAFRKTGGAFW